MSNKDKTLIVLVLDRSGSMTSIAKPTIESINGFLASQKGLPGETEIYFTQFDDKHETVHNFCDIKSCEPLTDKTFVPRGGTSLLDAIGFTINNVGANLVTRKEDDRPGTVIFAVMTDGDENTSHEFKRPQIFDMIKHQTDKYNWSFTFLGANQDAIQAGVQMGFSAGSSMTYMANAVGVKGVVGSLNSFALRSRSGEKADYTAAERSVSVGGTVDVNSQGVDKV